jgi:hypothetical protein
MRIKQFYDSRNCSIFYSTLRRCLSSALVYFYCVYDWLEIIRTENLFFSKINDIYTISVYICKIYVIWPQFLLDTTRMTVLLQLEKIDDTIFESRI